MTMLQIRPVTLGWGWREYTAEFWITMLTPTLMLAEDATSFAFRGVRWLGRPC